MILLSSGRDEGRGALVIACHGKIKRHGRWREDVRSCCWSGNDLCRRSPSLSASLDPPQRLLQVGQVHFDDHQVGRLIQNLLEPNNDFSRRRPLVGVVQPALADQLTERSASVFEPRRDAWPHSATSFAQDEIAKDRRIRRPTRTYDEDEDTERVDIKGGGLDATGFWWEEVWRPCHTLRSADSRERDTRRENFRETEVGCRETRRAKQSQDA